MIDKIRAEIEADDRMKEKHPEGTYMHLIATSNLGTLYKCLEWAKESKKRMKSLGEKTMSGAFVMDYNNIEKIFHARKEAKTSFK